MIYYIYVTMPLVCFLLNVAVQILAARNFKTLGLLKSVIAGFSIGLALLIIAEVALLDSLTSILANILTYSALGYCYFHFVNLGETARRIRILRELYEVNNGLSVNEILECYNAREIIEKRLFRLLKNEQIALKDNRYYIGNPIMLFISNVILSLKYFVLGKKNEFD